MEDSPIFNDENKQQSGKKRQQLESPFSAATPKSRIGKEPKRLFGQLKVNDADGNLEETCIDSDSRPNSATPSEVTFDSTNISNSDDADPNLEQTELFAAGSSANMTDLSMVEESDETSADVTLSNSFGAQLVVDEDRSTPTGPRLPLSPIMKNDDDETASVPTPLASRIGRGLETIDTHSNTSMQSPMQSAKSHIDYSLHEFEILEQKVEHEEDVKELHEKIEELRESHRLELIQIKEARVYEEKMLMQQMQTITKKAKSDSEAAKAREQCLEKLLQEMKIKMDSPVEENEQLKNEIVELQSRIEQLTENALQMNAIKESVTTYETRIEQLEATKVEMNSQLIEANKQIELLHQKSVEMDIKAVAEVESAKSMSSTLIDEIKSEHEEVRKMMMEEVKRLEDELVKQEDVANKLRSQAELAETKLADQRQKLEEAEAAIQRRESELVNQALQHKEQIDNLQVQSDEMRSSTSLEKESEIEELKIRIEELQSRIEQLTENALQMDAIKESMNSQLIEANKEIELLHQKSIEMDIKAVAEIEEVRKLMMEEVKRLEDELVKQEDVANNLRSQAEVAETNLTDQRQKLEEAEAKIQRRESELVNQALQHKEQIDNLQVQIEEMRSSKSLEKESETEELNARIEELQSRIEQLTENALQMDAIKESIEEVRTMMMEEVKRLEDELVKQEDVANNLRSQAEVAETNLTNQRQKLEEAEAEIQRRESELVNQALQHKEQIDKLQIQSDEMRSSTSLEKESEIEELKIRIEELQSRIEQLTENALQMDAIKESVITYETKIEQLEATKGEMNSQLIEANKEIELLHQKSIEMDIKAVAEVESAKSMSSTLINEIKSEHEEVRKLMMEDVKRLEDELVKQEDLANKLRSQAELAETKLTDQRQKLEEAEAEIQRRESELVNQALQHKEQIDNLQVQIEEMRSSKSLEKESETEELKIRIEELQAAITFAQKALEDAEQSKKQKDLELELTNQQMEKLKQTFEEEKSLHQNLLQEFSDISEKLEAAEQGLSQKENAIVTLESRIETMSSQFEERLGEANEWKNQALSVGTLTETMSQMQKQLKEMTEKLEASDRQVVEVKEMAQHDITLIQDEKNEQSAALEEAKNQIAQLEEKLAQSQKEIARLEKVCDDFDDDERELKEKIAQLQAEIKMLKGVKSPPKTMGLLQKARLGVKPLSRETSRVDPPVNEDGFEDAQDSFQPQAQPNHQQTLNQTAMELNSTRAQAAGNTMLHPDDQLVEKSTVETPSKKNRSNCNQQ
uniref:A-kinase anchor protein 9 n=1 Tax=Caenorhabditis tropicalis TaxID=1561998 RepID=A0A1I7U3E1_9PELO